VKNITITLESEVARWVRLQAAEREMSISRYVGEVLKVRMQERAAYEHAMQPCRVRIAHLSTAGL